MIGTIQHTIDILFSLGLLAAGLLMIPQIIKLIRVKNSKDFSLLSYAGFNIFQLGMVLHGVFQHDLALVIGMSLCFILNLSTVVLIVRYRQRRI